MGKQFPVQIRYSVKYYVKRWRKGGLPGEVFKEAGRDVKDIRPCIGCHDGCLGRSFENKPLCCAVNPATGRDRLFELKPALKVKNVMIGGGGVAGIEAARVATLRGHKVSLYEKSGSLGGHLIEACVTDFKKDIERLLNWYKVQLDKVGVNVILNTEVTSELVESEKPDVVIVATGSKPVLPKIKGIEKPTVATCTDLLLGIKKAGDTVVMVGGGLVGCETALWLAKQGKKVTIVEIMPDLMTAGLTVPHANRIMLLDLLALKRVEIVTSVTAHEITDEGLIVIDKKFESKEFNCDTVALALGLKSEVQLYNLLRGRVTQLYAIGDCKKPRRILEAIWDGYGVTSAI